jgi:hypothetical protein
MKQSCNLMCTQQEMMEECVINVTVAAYEKVRVLK